MTKLKNPDPDVSGPLQNKYSRLLSELPDSAYEKLGAEQLRTVEGRSKAITQLVSLHAGEVVELNPRRSTWLLRPKAAGPASADWQNEQWHCRQNGKPIGTHDDDRDQYECGKPDAWLSERDLSSQIILT